VEWDEADRCRDDAGVGRADDLEGDPCDRRTEPHNVPKRHLARKAAMQAVAARLQRDPHLPQYDMVINPAPTA
jgi:hypothetical protein